MDTQREKNPKCPYCNDELIPIAQELENGSGWIAGWSCACQEIRDIESYLHSLKEK